MIEDVHTFAALFASIVAVLYGAYIASDREGLVARLPWLLSVGGLVVLVGIPGFLPPIMGQESRNIVLGLLFLGSAAFLAVTARRSRAHFERAALSRKASSVFGAQELIGSGDGPVDIQLSGGISGDPPLMAPVSGQPCSLHRVEVRRARSGDTTELVAMDEGAADRLVLEDSSGRLAIAGAPALLARGAPLKDTLLEGEVDAGDWQGGGRFAQLAKRFDPDPPVSGRWRYEIRERALLDGVRVHVAGTLLREAGELVVRPLGQKLQFGDAPVADSLRIASWRSTALAAALAITGIVWLWDL